MIHRELLRHDEGTHADCRGESHPADWEEYPRGVLYGGHMESDVGHRRGARLLRPRGPHESDRSRVRAPYANAVAFETDAQCLIGFVVVRTRKSESRRTESLPEAVFVRSASTYTSP